MTAPVASVTVCASGNEVSFSVMNTRYVFSSGPYDLRVQLGVDVSENFPPRYNIAPSQPVPIIRETREDGREFALVRWGFVPGWDKKGEYFKKSIVNIRSESAPEKPSFRNAWRRRRCLFPMNGFYEWVQEKDGKQPYLITMGEDMPLFCVAGLWEYWLGENGSEMETAAFLTRESVYPITQLHSRMPIYVPPERYADWLEPDETVMAPAEAIIGLPPPPFEFWPVSRRVNSWKPDDEELIKPGRDLRQDSLL